MNANHFTCNQDQMSKHLPLKKRRAYLIDSSSTANENHSKIIKPSHSPDESCPLHAPTPPSSPHVEFLRQQYTGHSLNYHYLLAQQYLEHYRLFIDQRHGHPIVEDKQKRTDANIDEHFHKSLGENYSTFAGRCLTPDDSSSTSSPVEQNPVDSIEEHFARSLAKFRRPNDDGTSIIYHRMTESVVDDHFAKALGSTTWERLKEKS